MGSRRRRSRPNRGAVMRHLTDPVWITGIGTLTTLGDTYSVIADNLLAGRSGVGRVTTFDVSEHPCQIAGQIERVPCPADWGHADFSRLGLLEQLTLYCATGALRDAGWWPDRDRLRIGLVLGVGG